MATLPSIAQNPADNLRRLIETDTDRLEAYFISGFFPASI